ncbi:MAG: hypothetical protein FWD85_03270 [Microbacteriaceae bacterium]|nr:hypothetical protein [Microbacteriaceae bacterium]
MAGLFVDGAGVGALVSTLATSVGTSDASAGSGDSALRSLSSGATSAPLATALDDLAGRYIGQAGQHAEYVAELTAALARVGIVLEQADQHLAQAASRMSPR